LGWRIDGLPPDQSKLVMIGGPHTANFDVFLLVMMSWSLGVKMSFLVANRFASTVVSSGNHGGRHPH
jgi:hypothetical protein